MDVPCVARLAVKCEWCDGCVVVACCWCLLLACCAVLCDTDVMCDGERARRGDGDNERVDDISERVIYS